MRTTFKTMFGEILDPVKNFYRMRTRTGQITIILIPLLCGVLCYFVGSSVQIYSEIGVYEFIKDVLGDFITVLALFVSFTMGYLSIIITSGSENINLLKKTYSNQFIDKKGEYYSLYQILMTEITYTVLIEILVLLMCIIEKFVINCFETGTIKILCSINVSLLIYVLLLILIDVKNMYFSFWQSK